ncbi:hypothetical protein X742_14665 [Mesorhizobium sp. LNHC232B00]|nr:hypothetical protein X742_14665 [Mesorhizobium sp. LNHC232B00]
MRRFNDQAGTIGPIALWRPTRTSPKAFSKASADIRHDAFFAMFPRL